MNGNHDNGKVTIEYEDVNEQTLFTAKPVITADDETDKKFEEILQSANDTEQLINIEIDNQMDVSSEKSPGIYDSILSSSSNDDSLKIYNVPTGEIVKSKSADNISRRYKKTDDNDNIDIRDKNTAGINSVSAENVSSEIVREDRLGSIDELSEIQLPKVRDLARKFISMDNLNEEFQQIKPRSINGRKQSIENIIAENQDSKQPSTKQYMHSLTARSISKQFREGLKLSMATPLKMPGGTNELPEGEVAKESSRPESPLPEPGSIKTKLAFFESLRSKLNGNKF